MKTALICHEGAKISQEGLARWLGCISELAGIVVIKEPKSRKLARAKMEIKRVGFFRFLDVLAFRIYYKLFLSGKDKQIEQKLLDRILERYSPVRSEVPLLYVTTPNNEETKNFLSDIKPDILIARCKTLLKRRIFTIPSRGTYVLHPGVCPEYRNSHGCFWALANRDMEKVGATLLKIDEGIDTGPVYGYFSYAYDEAEESHVIIQYRVVTENLDRIRDKLIEIYEGTAQRLNTKGRNSGIWGQPWLSKYLKWKLVARRKK